jgi:hypothetical protein
MENGQENGKTEDKWNVLGDLPITETFRLSPGFVPGFGVPGFRR